MTTPRQTPGTGTRGDDNFDRAMMEIALRMAARGLGRAAPNPAVGAVIADEETGEVIARGWTQPGGRPHAETQAIAAAGSRSRGKTLFVTLEPCSHHGRTPPCADAIIEAGIRRVVAAIEDPDPRVGGRGLARLRDAGIAVRRGVLADKAHALTRGHIVRITERRPYVQLKMARAADGTIAQGKGDRPTWVTGPLARRMGHMLRARADAILIGAGTLRDDDPALDCRLNGMSDRSPRPVVVCGSTPPSNVAARKLLAPKRMPPRPVVAVPSSALAAYGPAISEAHADIVALQVVDGRIWLPALGEALVARGITRLLVEGGPAMWDSFLKARMVDEIVEFRALGDEEPERIVARSRREITANAGARQEFVLRDVRRFETDMMMTFDRTRPERAAGFGSDPAREKE